MTVKTRRNRTKRGGTVNATQKNQLNGDNERKSLFAAVGTAAANAFKGTVNFLEDKGARMLGFKRINQDEEAKQEPSEMTQKASELASTASNIASGVASKANQVGSLIIGELNKKLDSEEVKGTITQAIGNTVEIAKDIVENANEKLNNPEFVGEVAEATKNVSNTAATVIEAAEPAINQVIDQTSEIGEKMFSKVGDSVVNVALNTAEAIPGVGAGIGLIRDIDKAATAGEAIVEAGMKTATTFADGIAKTEDALKKKMEETKNIATRTSQGINAFNAVDKVIPVSKMTTSLKRGGSSRKFKRIRKKLSRKLRFR
uniref:Uncharacterized protein n=1 Tax=viral metagenome TaxID=1070528 RepID=A0A6C0K120_9ZZZZ